MSYFMLGWFAFWMVLETWSHE